MYMMHFNHNKCLYLCEMNDSNDTKDRMEELDVLCYFKVPALPMKWSKVDLN
jgi:hypothetical protein